MKRRQLLVKAVSAVLLGVAGLAQAATPGGEAAGGRACELALAEVARAAMLRGWQAEARCVGRAPTHAVHGVDPLPTEADLRSGLLALNLRGSAPGQPVGRVTVRVTFTAPGWVASRALSRGAELEAADLAIAQRRWPDGQRIDLADAVKAPVGRMLRNVREGEPVLADAWAPAGSVMRGDRVQAVMSSAGVEVQLAALVVAPARAGERVRVQPAGRAEVLVGVLQDDHTVRVEGL